MNFRALFKLEIAFSLSLIRFSLTPITFNQPCDARNRTFIVYVCVYVCVFHVDYRIARELRNTKQELLLIRHARNLAPKTFSFRTINWLHFVSTFLHFAP